MSFESELSQGRFTIPECTECKKTVWPPAEFCNNCFGQTHLKKEVFEGRVLEFSKQDDAYFCLVEFDNAVKIMAKMLKIPRVDQAVKISKCGISDDGYFFEIS